MTTAQTLEQRCIAKITELFLAVVAESGDEESLAALPFLRKKVNFVQQLPITHVSVDHPDIETFVSSIPRHIIPRFAQLDAKLIDVSWRARRIASMFVLNTLMEHGGVHNGDKFEDVIKRLRAHDVPPDVVQKLVDDAVLWPSLTTHPTNPTSLAYTKAGLEVDRLLSDPKSTASQLKVALKVLLGTEMDEARNAAGARRKLPSMEGEELLAFLGAIYNSSTSPVLTLRATLKKYGYESINVSRLLDVHVWGPGDGDGNPNMDANALLSFIAAKHRALMSLYAADLASVKLAEHAEKKAALMDAISAAVGASNIVESAKRVAVAFEQLRTHRHACAGLDELFIKFDCFGTTLAGIDVRHNSRDITTTVGRLLEATDGIPFEDFLNLSPEQSASVIRSRLADPSIRQRVRELGDNPAAVLAKSSNAETASVAARVFARMMVIAAHPGYFSKFIIAETTSIANVLGALLLLYCGGVNVMRKGTPIDVVPLFESRQDLRAAPSMVHKLLIDQAFGAHVAERGHFLVMIAKSDTARLSGAGVQGAQEETIGQLLSMNPVNYGGKRVFVMLGGGDDQMRGGGRIVESPHVVLRAEAREGGHNPARLAMTIQGMQLQLVFGCPILVHYFVEGVAAHLILSNARIQGHIPWRKTHPSVNETAAARQAHHFFGTAMDKYEALIGTDGKRDATRRSLSDYLNCFPAEIIEWTNKSSRPGARQKTADPFQGRAISLDQRAKHDGAYLTATIGLRDAMLSLAAQLQCGNSSEQGVMEAHRHTYAGNKSFRDFIRMQATVLYQKDYEFAWALRGGVPSFIERQQLEDAQMSGGYNPPRVTLAVLQAADLQLAYLLYVAVTGKQPPEGAVDLKLPLRAGWRDLANALDARERLSVIAKRLQLKAARRINEAKIAGGTADIVNHQSLAYYAYVGTNPALSSPNFSLTLTDPFKEDGLPLLSETNPAIAGKIPSVAWLALAAKL